MNEYEHAPWSRTPLKPLFHRTVPSPGNTNTPFVSKLDFRKNRDNAVIQSNSSANWKMLVQHATEAKDSVSKFSLDTGMHESPFQGNYFDMNKGHLSGQFLPMLFTPELLQGKTTSTLTLHPKKSKGATQDETTQESSPKDDEL